MNLSVSDPNRGPVPERLALAELLARESAQTVNADVEALAADLARKPGVLAIVFYGSGLWERAGADTLYDFYVVVDRFRAWGASRTAAVAGNVLPPNVYYQELRRGQTTVRSKYAVIRLQQFQDAARGRSFTPHIWGRFCQPCRLLHVRDDAVRAMLLDALVDATVTFHERTIPLVEASVALSTFWETGLRSTYASEIRSEPPARVARLVAAHREAFAERSRLALPCCSRPAALTPEAEVISALSVARRRWFRLGLALKRPLQKAVPVGRLIKASFTFHGGIDYLRWKVERHSGIAIEITDFHRRHPVICGLYLLWVARRRGAVR